MRQLAAGVGEIGLSLTPGHRVNNRTVVLILAQVAKVVSAARQVQKTTDQIRVTLPQIATRAGVHVTTDSW